MKDIFDEIKIAIENAILLFNIHGMIAFGSRVKGGATPKKNIRWTPVFGHFFGRV